MTKTASSGSATTIAQTITSVQEAQAAAMEASAAASAAAVETFQTEEASLVSQMEALAGQLSDLHVGLEAVGIEEFSVPDLSGIDYLFTNTVRSTPKRRAGRPRNAAAESTAASPRGSKPCSLPDAILMGMNTADRGTEFSIAEITSLVQSDPINYPFSGTANSTQVTISQRLRELVDGKFVRKASRGVYVISASGQKAANVALAEMTAEPETAE